MNVVYFLHPLEKYAKEMKRILKRGKGILKPHPDLTNPHVFNGVKKDALMIPSYDTLAIPLFQPFFHLKPFLSFSSHQDVLFLVTNLWPSTEIRTFLSIRTLPPSEKRLKK